MSRARSLQLVNEATDPAKLRRRIAELEKAIVACRATARDPTRSASQRQHARATWAWWRELRLVAHRRLGELTHGRCARCGQRLLGLLELECAELLELERQRGPEGKDVLEAPCTSPK